MSLSDEDVITKVNLFCLDCAILKIKFLNFLDFELKKHSISGQPWGFQCCDTTSIEKYKHHTMCVALVFSWLCLQVTCALHVDVCNDTRPSSASSHDPLILMHFPCLTGLTQDQSCRILVLVYDTCKLRTELSFKDQPTYQAACNLLYDKIKQNIFFKYSLLYFCVLQNFGG